MAEKLKSVLVAEPKTYLGTSNFGNTKVNGTLNVANKVTLEVEGVIGAESKEAVTGNQIHNVKTELEGAISSASSDASEALEAAKTELNQKISEMDTAYKATDTVLDGKITTLSETLEGKQITVAGDAGDGYTVNGAAGGLKFVGGANIDTTVANNGDVTIALEDQITVSGLTVNGDLNVTGTTTTVNSEDLVIKDNMITLNSGEAGEGVSKGTAGIEINRGTQAKYQVVFDETDDKLKAGPEGDTKALATEEYVTESISNAVVSGAEQIVNGQWKLTVEEGSLVIKYGDKLLASWEAPVDDSGDPEGSDE